MTSEYDARQVCKMKQQLRAFQCGELSLGGFIGDVDFLLNAIEEIPLDWKERVHDFVSTLEVIYAVSLDQGRTEVDDEDMKQVAEATEGIRRCLEEISIPESLKDL